MATKTPLDKSVFGDDQDITNIDITKLYNNYIKEIDKYRSHFSPISNQILVKGKITKANSLTALSNGPVPRNEQESRCHAFYRMIGFPIIYNNLIHNPGYDKSLNLDENLIKNLENIANSIDIATYNAMNERELYVKNILNVFSKQDNNAIARSAWIGINPTIFSNLSEGVFNTVSNTYSNDTSTVYNFKKLYPDSAGVDPTINFSQVKHCIKPLIVDPRIELTVTPCENSICAPFLEDNTDTAIKPGKFLKRPLIEKIISLRCGDSANNASTTVDNSSFVTEIIDFISFQTDADDSLNEVVLNFKTTLGKRSLLELQSFNKFIKILDALANKLFLNKKEIENIFEKIDWAPIPSKNGIEYGCTLRNILLNGTNNKQIEQDIIQLKITQDLDSILVNIKSSTESNNTAPDIGSFTFNGNATIYNEFTNVNKTQESQLPVLLKSKENLGKNANSLLFENDVITGESIGIGLIDIISIIAAFWIMDLDYLIYMLDDRCFNRLKTNSSLICPEVYDRNAQTSRPDKYSPDEVLKKYEEYLRQILLLANKFYKDREKLF